MPLLLRACGPLLAAARRAAVANDQVERDVMDTYPSCDASGRMLAFEIEMVYITLGRIMRLLKRVPETSHIVARPAFYRDPVHVRFWYRGHELGVLEPFGDNSRYWIGPVGRGETVVDVQEIERVFRQYRPPWLVNVLGDIVTFKFLRR